MPIALTGRGLSLDEAEQDVECGVLGVEISERVLSDVMAEAAEHAEVLRKLRNGLDGLEGTAESDDHLVSVTVSARGEPVALELDPRIYRKPDSDALATSIMETIVRAREDVDKKGAAVLDDLIPDYRDDNDTDPDIDPVLRELDRQAQRKAF